MIARLFKRFSPPCEHCARLTTEKDELFETFKRAAVARDIARKGQAAQDRKITALRQAHPDIWQAYFAKGTGSDN